MSEDSTVKTRRRNVRVDEDLLERIKALERLRVEYHSASDAYANALRHTIAALILRGYSKVHIGELIGLTRQRACQIIREIDGDEEYGLQKKESE